MTTETITREKKYIVALDQEPPVPGGTFDRNANIIDIAQRNSPNLPETGLGGA